MKIRNGFVSNSSSCSFVIIKDNGTKIELPENLTVGQNGIKDFDWDYVDHYDTYTKINWAVLQILYMKESCDFTTGLCLEVYEDNFKNCDDWERCLDLFENVVKKNGVKTINYDLYINHPECREDHWFDFFYGVKNKTLDDNVNFGYIDHQSTIPENPSLKIIFRDETSLKNFLLNSNSYIICGNDNEDRSNHLCGYNELLC